MAKVKTPTKKVLDRQTAKELSSQLITSITIQNGIHLSDKKRPCGIHFHDDADQYFDPVSYSIHMGIFGPTEIFEVETEEDYVAGLQYLYGHENQHVRSTARAPYDNGIKRAAHAIIEYIATKEGIRKNFRNERDYEVFVQTELPAKGIHVSYQTIAQICARAMNSVEDGRIERIRSLEFPGFEKQRRYFRAMIWAQNYDFKPFADGLNEADKLNLYLNNILSLATTGLYLRGFVAEYGGTEIMEEMKQFLPFIAKGVLAGRTRTMADNVVEIAKLLAPYIYAVCKYNPSEAEQMMQKMLAELLKQLLSEMNIDTMADTSEREEEQDDGIPAPVFPMSDLVITLDDETYDKLMEKAKKSGQSGGGLMIRREHPKDEEKKDEDDKSGSGSGNGDKKQDADKNGSGSNGKGGEQKDGNGSSVSKAEQDGQNGQSGSSASDSSGQNGESGNSSDANGSASKDAPKPYSKEYSHSEGGSCEDTKSNQGSHQSGGGENGSEEMVLEQMKKAATECREDVTDMMSAINQSVEHTAKTNRGRAPVKQDVSKPITESEVKDICARGFKEEKRKYKLDQNLPPMLKSRADTFRKKNERYFRSLSTPNVTNLDSGSVDPSLIYGLSFGETSIFRRIGIDKKFDGCVYILLDNSGSMCGNKRTEAAKAAAVIEEGFKGIIPIKIVAFDTCGPIIHEVIKGWDESQKLNCCWNFAKHGRNGCGNDDGKDILIAQRELLSRPEEKKLLIVLSDGAPSSIEETKQAIDDTRKKGINVFGIYFEDGCIGSDADDFKYMYTKDYVCCELKDVDETLTKLMIKFSRS